MADIAFVVLIFGLLFGGPLLSVIALYISRKYPERRTHSAGKDRGE